MAQFIGQNTPFYWFPEDFIMGEVFRSGALEQQNEFFCLFFLIAVFVLSSPFHEEVMGTFPKGENVNTKTPISTA